MLSILFCLSVSSQSPSQRAGIAPNLLSSAEALARLKAEQDPYWLRAKEEAYEDSEKVLSRHLKETAGGQRLAKIVHGDETKREIALTFDDGPHDGYTARLLDVLKKEKVPATFFVIGFMAETRPELLRRMIKEGHTVGNHTYHHVSLPKIPIGYVADELLACGEVVRTIIGKPPVYFRPPGGRYTPAIASTAANLGYTTVLWTADPGDYANPGPEVVLKRTVDATRNGGILLLHDGIEQTIQTLPRLIADLRAKGYRFVTMDRLVAGAVRAGQPIRPAASKGKPVRRS